MKKKGEINWFWIIFILILLILLVLSKIPSGIEYSTGVSDEHECYLACENNFYLYTEGENYDKCECRVSLLNKLIRWISNKD